MSLSMKLNLLFFFHCSLQVTLIMNSLVFFFLSFFYGLSHLPITNHACPRSTYPDVLLDQPLSDLICTPDWSHAAAVVAAYFDLNWILTTSSNYFCQICLAYISIKHLKKKTIELFVTTIVESHTRCSIYTVWYVISH